MIDAVVKRLHSDFPEIQIAGYRNGFLDESDILQLEEDVLKTKPGLIFVAQGSPRQEKLMLRLQSRHQAIYMGLGGSFDVFTGKVSRAPAFIKQWSSVVVQTSFTAIENKTTDCLSLLH